MKKNISFHYGFDSDYRTRIHLLKEVGFDGVMSVYEYSPDFYEAMDYSLKQGLNVESIHLPFREIVNDLWLSGYGGEYFTDLMIAGGKYAKSIGVDKCTLHLSSSPNPPPMSDAGFARLRKIADYYAENNLTLCIENLRRIDYFRAVVDAIPSVKVCYDVGHHNIYYPNGFDILEYKDRVALLHLHDNFGTKDEHYLPFEGTCDWEKICNKIAQLPLAPDLTLEVHGARDKNKMATEKGFLLCAMDTLNTIESIVNRYAKE